MPTPAPRTLLDSTDPSDARLMGWDRACDPAEHDEGLILKFDGGASDGIPQAILYGPDGEVPITGRAAILAVIDSLSRALSSASVKARAA